MKYEIKEAPFSVLECQLEAGEAVRCQKGAMAWMTRGIVMQTQAGGIGKFLKKKMSGESGFWNNYVAESDGSIAFSMTFPGQIVAVDVSKTPLAAQKSAFLASGPDVDMDIFLQEKISSGFFGGEGFIMEKFTGSGIVFLEIDGGIIQKELAAGEEIVIDSGYLAAMDLTCSMRIERIKGMGNMIAGGEGLFNTIVAGPGRVWLQTMPISSFVDGLIPHLPFKRE
ncbi:MAG: TIGR00266 family protein [Anaerovoracaceae bacterium]